MATHNFSIDHARKYGVDEAIILHNLIFWIEKNRANKRHQFDGRTWTYNSIEAFRLLFPYFSKKQLRRILKSLEKKNLIITGNYNKNPYDRTTWYALREENEFLQQNVTHIFAPSSEDKIAMRLDAIKIVQAGGSTNLAYPGETTEQFVRRMQYENRATTFKEKKT